MRAYKANSVSGESLCCVVNYKVFYAAYIGDYTSLCETSRIAEYKIFGCFGEKADKSYICSFEIAYAYAFFYRAERESLFYRVGVRI